MEEKKKCLTIKLGKTMDNAKNSKYNSLQAEYYLIKQEYDNIIKDIEFKESNTDKWGDVGDAISDGMFRLNPFEIADGAIRGLWKGVKTATGISGIQNRNSAKKIQEISEQTYNIASNITEKKRKILNKEINEFGKFRLECLHNTVGRFLAYLKDMDQRNKEKEYEILDNIGLRTNTIREMEHVDMKVSEALKSTTITGALGAAAAMGTPTLVTSAVGALATASTGTAISGLSGAAATNATLAWLGGGSLATGGGGMAAGAATLTGITVGATAGVAILAAGLMVSTHYAKKLTEVKNYQKEVDIALAKIETGWVVMDGISNRIQELTSVTTELDKRLSMHLDYLEPLVIDFNTSDEYYNRIFQENGLFVKAMSELAQSPLLDNEGQASDISAQIILKTHKILNTEL